MYIHIIWNHWQSIYEPVCDVSIWGCCKIPETICNSVETI